MPMTTRLLQRLSDTLGEEATNDLLGYLEGERHLNRAEFRQIAESYYDRFDHLLRQEVARLDTGIEGLRKDMTRLEIQLGAAIGELRGELASTIGGLRGELASAIGGLRSELGAEIGELRGELASAISGLRAEIGGVRTELGAEIGALRGELGSTARGFRGELASASAELRGEFKAGLADQRADLLKWMFLFWAGTVAPLAGLMIALAKL